MRPGDPGGEVLATALLQLHDDHAYVALLATPSDQRGRGLVQALLVDALRRGQAARRFELSTDSRTGTLSLYEKMGMG